jgi:type IV secretion system protein VirB3
MENNVFNFSRPVYKAIQEPNQLLGIGLIPAMFILIFTIILINIINLWCAIIGVILFIIARKICKKDPLQLIIVYERILEPERWYA